MSARKQAVLDAATRLLAVNPRASMQDIATAAGISRATLHRYFSSRDELIEALGLLAVDRITAAYAAARLDEGTVLEALERLVEALVPVVHQFAFLVSETQIRECEDVTKSDRELQVQTEHLMRRGQIEGTLRSDRPAAWLPYALSGLFLAAEEAVRMGDIAPREASQLVLDSFLHGAAAGGRDSGVSAVLSISERTNV